MFGRRRKQPEEPLDEDGLVDERDRVESDEDSGEAAPPRGVALSDGPWDVREAPDDGLARIDLGGLRVPVPDGIEVRVELDQQTQQVVAATLVDGHSTMQVNAFAAPKSVGIWADVRDEIVQSVRAAGGHADVVDGPFGKEIRGRVPTDAAKQPSGLHAARFVGVDGPRWFLRGLLTGPAATDAVQAQRLEDTFRRIVVVRGGEAMAPRDPLPLQLPREAMEAAEQTGEEGRRDDLNPFERGPEITEVR